MTSSPSEIISACHTNFDFQYRYPDMQHRDWEKLVTQFVHDIQECYGLKIQEIFKSVT